jgi:hypothetical protein
VLTKSVCKTARVRQGRIAAARNQEPQQRLESAACPIRRYDGPAPPPRVFSEEPDAAQGHVVALVRRIAATGARSDVVPNDGLGNHHQPVARCARAQAVIGIFVVHEKAFVEQAGLFQAPALHQNGTGGDEIHLEGRPIQADVPFAAAAAGDLLGHPLAPRTHRPYARGSGRVKNFGRDQGSLPGQGRIHQQIQGSRCDEGIVIDQKDIVGAPAQGIPDTCVGPCGKPEVAPVFNLLYVRESFVNALNGAIGRAVVHDENAKAGIGRSPQGCETRQGILSPVPVEGDDIDQGTGGSRQDGDYIGDVGAFQAGFLPSARKGALFNGHSQVEGGSDGRDYMMKATEVQNEPPLGRRAKPGKGRYSPAVCGSCRLCADGVSPLPSAMSPGTARFPETSGKKTDAAGAARHS